MTTPTAEAVAFRIQELIVDDVEAGLLPADDIASYEDLHNHVDANDYIIEARERSGLPANPSLAEGHDFDNAVTDIVDVWLRVNKPVSREALALPRP